VENSDSDNAHWAAVMTNVSEDSGLGGKVLIQLICRIRNLNPVDTRKIIKKLTLKSSTSLVKFFTIIDYHGANVRARVKSRFRSCKKEIFET
jgi:alpha-mannosidase